MIVSIKKWGNSASIRIPVAMLEAVDMSIDQEVELHEDRGRLIIEPLLKPRYDLKELIDGITDDNLHDLQLEGKPVGREIW